MKFNISGLNFKTMMAFVMFSVIWFTNAALAATHDIHLSANTLPNGQYAFKMEKHTSSDGTTPLYPAEATIPGPTVFVKKVMSLT